jgi:hypothetical protein
MKVCPPLGQKDNRHELGSDRSSAIKYSKIAKQVIIN